MSTAKVKATTVVRACNAYLERHQAAIDAGHEDLISDAMLPRHWLASLFGAKQRTREQAIAHLKVGPFTPWHELAISSGWWAERAKKLRSLAERSQSEYMDITPDDAWVLAFATGDAP